MKITHGTPKWSVSIAGLYSTGKVRLSIRERDTTTQAEMDVTTALSIAAEILMVSGHSTLSQQVYAASSQAKEEEKLQSRRDALAASLGMPSYNRVVRPLHAAAIDRIIELEDGQAK